MRGRSDPREGSSAADRARWAATYEETPYQELPWFDPGPDRAVEQAVADGFFVPGVAVLDLGCGAGSNVLFLATKGYEAHGVDLSPGAVRAALARARAAGVSVDVRVGDALALDFSEGAFGGLVDIGCFHTLPLHRRSDYAREVARVLRPGGGFILSWVAREQVGEHGPRHRPSLGEVTDALERWFLFARTEFRASVGEEGPAVYHAWLRRRSAPQPRRR